MRFRSIPTGGRSIRFKLFAGYAGAFIVLFGIASALMFMAMKSTIETNVRNELLNSTTSLKRMVEAAADVAVRNHLRAAAEHNVDIVEGLWQRAKAGEFDMEEAKRRARTILLSQRIAQTGYLYCVNSEGVLLVHPEMEGQSAREHDFIQKQSERKRGYLEYSWRNPSDRSSRPKALYMSYFAPWDWIVTATSYRDEFNELIAASDLRNSVLSLVFGETGYAYIIDESGTLLVHPKLEGTNIADSKDAHGRAFIRELLRDKRGQIVYPWRNPGEQEAREKLVLFDHIPRLGWIVASSSYLDEIYAPLHRLTAGFVIGLGIVLVLIFSLTLGLSSSITRPLRALATRLANRKEGDFSVRLPVDSRDEVGLVAEQFNGFMDSLASVTERLQCSERDYRTLFENAVEGIYQTDRDGRLLRANPSLAKMLGYVSAPELLADVTDVKQVLYADPESRDELLALLESGQTVTDFEIELRRRDGTPLWAALSARGVIEDDGQLTRIEGFMSDITERVQAQRVLQETNEQLERRVEERTEELSRRLGELRRRNDEGGLLQQLTETLQSCNEEEETHPVVCHYGRRLFPAAPGHLFLFDGDRATVRCVASWGDEETPAPFAPDACWALRRAKPFRSTGESGDLRCGHEPAPKNGGSLCVPISGYGETTGLLHIELRPEIAGSTEARDRLERKARHFAERLGLAYANLSLQESLRAQSLRDPLTGLHNRRFLERALERESERARRDESTVAVLMLDVDHFKRLNDTHGHQAGDIVLRELGNYLNKTTRSSDIKCRYGGEEFVVLFRGLAKERAFERAEELRRGIANDVRAVVIGAELRLTVSIGLAVFPAAGTDIGETLAAADAALYRAKRGGRNRVEVAPALSA